MENSSVIDSEKIEEHDDDHRLGTSFLVVVTTGLDVRNKKETTEKNISHKKKTCIRVRGSNLMISANIPLSCRRVAVCECVSHKNITTS